MCPCRSASPIRSWNAGVSSTVRTSSGAARLLAVALATARRAGVAGLLIVRADSAFYDYDIVEAYHRAGARFSITARLAPTITRAIAAIDENAWTSIRYAGAIWDADEQQSVSDA